MSDDNGDPFMTFVVVFFFSFIILTTLLGVWMQFHH